MSGLGSGWAPPSTFKFPTTADYVSGVASGMAAIRPIVESKVESFIAPIKAQASGVIASVEASTKKFIPLGGDAMSIYAAAQAIGSSKDAVTALVAVDGLLKGTLNFSTDLAKAIPQLSSILKIAPQVVASANVIIGAAISVIQLIAQSMGPSKEELAEKCQELLQQRKVDQCSSFVKMELDAMGTAVGGGTTPADLFRTYAYCHVKPDNPYYKNRYDLPIPLSLGSMYVGLCGDQVPANYRKTARSVGKMSDATRRQMWMLIQGILAAIEDPNQPPKASAGGMALYPALQGLIWNEFESGRLTEADVGSVAEQVGGQRTASAAYKTVYCGESCGPIVKEELFKAFMKNKLAFRGAYFTPELGWDAAGQKWRTSLVPLLPAKKAAVTLALSSGGPAFRAAMQATSNYNDQAKKPSTMAVSGLATGALIIGGIGAAGYFLARGKGEKSQSK